MTSDEFIGATRENVAEYLQNVYGTSPEFLWRAFPHYAVFRRPDNRKWYAAIMDVPRNKLGLEGNEKIDILDIRCNSAIREIFRQKRGFLPAYHMNRDNWITVILDGTVDLRSVCELAEDSYDIARGKSARLSRSAAVDSKCGRKQEFDDDNV